LRTWGTWKRMSLAFAFVIILSIPWYVAQQDRSWENTVSGKVTEVVDGDTLDVQGIGRIRLVGVNTPEKGQPGYTEATHFLKSECLGRTVTLDIDDECPRDPYGRVLAVVYVGEMNVNAELLQRGYAEILYLPPSEFDPYSWQKPSK